MYCQTCGAECQPGLIYCNRCGAVVNPSALAMTSELVPVDFSKPVRVIGTTICITTLLGLVILFFGLSGLAAWDFRKDSLMALGAFGMFMLFVTELSLIRLLSRLLIAPQQKNRWISFGKRGEKELRPAPMTAQFAPALNQHVPSVTEHTTRTFSPIYKEPRSQ